MVQLILIVFFLLVPPHVLAEETPPIIITEIMYNPSVNNTIADDKGEWFEIYNKGTSDVSLKGFSVGNHVITLDVTISPNSYATLCRNGNTEVNGGVTCVDQYSGLTLGNNNGEIILYYNGVEIDKAIYDDADWGGISGASIELTDLTSDNLITDNWHVAYTSFGDGDKGTPGKANSPAPTATPTITPTPTHTPKPTPTDTPTPTPKPTDTPVPTPIPPTSTKIPTATRVPQKQVARTTSPSPTRARTSLLPGEPSASDVETGLRPVSTVDVSVLGSIDGQMNSDSSSVDAFAAGNADAAKERSSTDSPSPIPYVILGIVATVAMVVSAVVIKRKQAQSE